MRSRLVVTALLVLLTACTNPPPPAEPPLYAEAPPPMTATGHATYIAERTLPVPASTVRMWLTEGQMLSFLTSTENVAKPVGYVVLKGTWPEVGSVRRIEQRDGHYLAEIVTANTATVFAYQIYGLTGPAGRSIDYGRGKFEFVGIDASTSTLRWTYELKPRNPIAGVVVRRFVANDFGPFMEGGMTAMAGFAATTASSPRK